LFYLFIYLCGSAQVWTQGFSIIGQGLYHLNHPPAHFWFSFFFVFQIGFCAFCLRWPQTLILLTVAFHVTTITEMHLMPGSFVRLGLANFFPRLTSNCDSPDLHLLRCWNYRYVPPCPSQWQYIYSWKMLSEC
jgi:hypothetical protein